MKVGFIGAGRVGKTLGQYFRKNQISVSGYYSRNFKHAEEGARLTQSMAFLNMEDLISTADAIFITVSDDAIEEIVSTLAKVGGIYEDHILIHTSGVHSTEVFSPFEQRGCGLYSIHPLQSFADSDKAVSNMNKTYFTIEGNGVHLHRIRELFKKLKNHFTIIEKEQKAMYHAGACVLSNYLVTLMKIGFDYIEASGFPKEEIYSAFTPLIHCTLDNIAEKGPLKSLTGPIQRGDVNTIDSHVKAIHKNNEDLEFYRVMGRKTIEMLERDDIQDENKKRIKKLLEG